MYIQKTKIMASGPVTSWQIDGETVKTVAALILWGWKGDTVQFIAVNSENYSEVICFYLSIILPN